MKRYMSVSLVIFCVLWSGAAGANGYEGYIVALDAALQRKIQERLLEEGFDPGGVDGRFGRKSEAALLRYREQNNILEEDPALNRVLTPKLARVLLGVEIEPGEDGDDLNSEEQLEVLRSLGLIPSADYWSDQGIILP